MSDEPWGLDGSTFSSLYGFALVLACCAVALACAAARRPSFNDAVPVELGTYECAYLNGGAHRVADTALAGLVAAGKVRITRRGEVAFVGPKEPEDSFQQLVREHLNGRSRVSDVRRAVRPSGECAPLERSLRDQELLVPGHVRRRAVAVMALRTSAGAAEEERPPSRRVPGKVLLELEASAAAVPDQSQPARRGALFRAARIRPVPGAPVLGRGGGGA